MSSSEIERFAREWPAQLERWRRFADWERERLAAAPPEFATAVAWMSQAWELAGRHDPDWGSTARVLERCVHHARIQSHLARAGLSG
jgi:hypothetical protein